MLASLIDLLAQIARLTVVAVGTALLLWLAGGMQ